MKTLFSHIIYMVLSLLLSSLLYAQNSEDMRNHPYETTQDKAYRNQGGKNVKGNWPENKLSNKYLLSPSARGMEAKEFNYQNVCLGINMLNVGVAKFLSVDVVVLPAFLIPGGNPMIIGLHSKLSFPIHEYVHLGVGGLYAATLAGESDDRLGLGYGVLTLGGKDKNISIGLGGMKDLEYSPVITAAASYRVGARNYLIAESYSLSQLIQPDAHLGILGARFTGRKFSLDYGVIVFSSGGSFIGPWLGATVPLGAG